MLNNISQSKILRKFDIDNDLNHIRKLGIRDMLNSKNLKKSVIMMSSWVIACVICFTLALNTKRNINSSW